MAICKRLMTLSKSIRIDVEGEIVVDRFHVAQNYRDRFDSLRKKEFKRLKQELSNECYEQDCKGMLWVLRKNHVSLKLEERQRLRCLFKRTSLYVSGLYIQRRIDCYFRSSLHSHSSGRGNPGLVFQGLGQSCSLLRSLHQNPAKILAVHSQLLQSTDIQRLC